MTEIVKLTVDGEEHWTASGSPAHQELLARLPGTEQQAGDVGQDDVDQIEEGAGADQQEPEVRHDGDDHNATGAGGEPSNRTADSSGTARGARRAGPTQSAAGS